MCGQTGNIVEKKRKPTMIVYNVLHDIKIDNAADIICEQNQEITQRTADITTKLIT
jgi:hypothetical protein